MHADEDALWLKKVPFYVPTRTAPVDRNNMDIDSINNVMGTAAVMITSRCSDDLRHFI